MKDSLILLELLILLTSQAYVSPASFLSFLPLNSLVFPVETWFLSKRQTGKACHARSSNKLNLRSCCSSLFSLPVSLSPPTSFHSLDLLIPLFLCLFLVSSASLSETGRSSHLERTTFSRSFSFPRLKRKDGRHHQHEEEDTNHCLVSSLIRPSERDQEKSEKKVASFLQVTRKVKKKLRKETFSHSPNYSKPLLCIRTCLHTQTLSISLSLLLPCCCHPAVLS